MSNKPPTFGNPLGSKVSGCSILATENDFYKMIKIKFFFTNYFTISSGEKIPN
jgi:hypothetical protein